MMEERENAPEGSTCIDSCEDASFLLALPTEILCAITQYLGLYDRIALSSTCRRLRSVSTNQQAGGVTIKFGPDKIARRQYWSSVLLFLQRWDLVLAGIEIDLRDQHDEFLRTFPFFVTTLATCLGTCELPNLKRFALDAHVDHRQSGLRTDVARSSFRFFFETIGTKLKVLELNFSHPGDERTGESRPPNYTGNYVLMAWRHCPNIVDLSISGVTLAGVLCTKLRACSGKRNETPCSHTRSGLIKISVCDTFGAISVLLAHAPFVARYNAEMISENWDQSESHIWSALPAIQKYISSTLTHLYINVLKRPSQPHHFGGLALEFSCMWQFPVLKDIQIFCSYFSLPRVPTLESLCLEICCGDFLLPPIPTLESLQVYCPKGTLDISNVSVCDNLVHLGVLGGKRLIGNAIKIIGPKIESILVAGARGRRAVETQPILQLSLANHPRLRVLHLEDVNIATLGRIPEDRRENLLRYVRIGRCPALADISALSAWPLPPKSKFHVSVNLPNTPEGSSVYEWLQNLAERRPVEGAQEPCSH